MEKQKKEIEFLVQHILERRDSNKNWNSCVFDSQHCTVSSNFCVLAVPCSSLLPTPSWKFDKKTSESMRPQFHFTSSNTCTNFFALFCQITLQNALYLGGQPPIVKPKKCALAENPKKKKPNPSPKQAWCLINSQLQTLTTNCCVYGDLKWKDTNCASLHLGLKRSNQGPSVLKTRPLDWPRNTRKEIDYASDDESDEFPSSSSRPTEPSGVKGLNGAPASATPAKRGTPEALGLNGPSFQDGRGGCSGLRPRQLQFSVTAGGFFFCLRQELPSTRQGAFCVLGLVRILGLARARCEIRLIWDWYRRFCWGRATGASLFIRKGIIHIPPSLEVHWKLISYLQKC